MHAIKCNKKVSCSPNSTCPSQALSIPVDVVTFGVVLYNVSVVGVLGVFFCRIPIFLTQCYLVLIAAVVAFWFTHLPEWTTWLMLVAMALYDLLAVLAPGQSPVLTLASLFCRGTARALAVPLRFRPG